MIAWRIALTLGREGVRALASPLRFAFYLMRRPLWQARAEAALAAPLPALEDPDAQIPIPESRPHLFISAGEASGEGHALRLMHALHDQGVRPRWSCFGSQAMADAGGELLYPLASMALMGFLPVFLAIGKICGAVARYERLLREDPPDAVVLVDNPGLHLVLAEAARRRRIPVLHYIAPQYWAWAPWRVHRYRRAIDRSLCILPFEVAYLASEGVRSTYVGNPLLDDIPAPSAAEQRERVLCLLPGSRSKEIALNLPGMVDVARALVKEEPGLRVVIAHRDSRRAEQVRELLQELGADFVELQIGPPGNWLATARVVLAKSGTGSLEACLYGTPTVVVYRLRESFTLAVYKRLVCIPWFASANLIAGRQIVPEFAFTKPQEWSRVTDAVRELFAEGTARAQCLVDLAELRQRLGGPGASQRAAHALRGFLYDNAEGSR